MAKKKYIEKPVGPEYLMDVIRREIAKNVSPDVYVTEDSIMDKLSGILDSSEKSTVDDFSQNLWNHYLSQDNNLTIENDTVRLPDNIKSILKDAVNGGLEKEREKLIEKYSGLRERIDNVKNPEDIPEDIIADVENTENKLKMLDDVFTRLDIAKSGKPTVFSEYDFSPDYVGELTNLSGLSRFTMFFDKDGKINVKDKYDFYSKDQSLPVKFVTASMDHILGKPFPIADRFDEGGTVVSEGDDWTSEDVGNPVYSKQSHRAVDQKARDEKFKSDLADQRQAGFEEVVVPAVEGVIDFTPVIGDIKSGYEMLMYTKEGNYAMASLSALSLFPGIPGAKTMGRLLSKPGERLVTKMKGHGLPYLKEVLNTAFAPKRFVDMVTWFDREGGIDQARKFSEMFPILPQDVIKANQKAEQAAVEGVNFVDSYYKDPKVKSRLQKLWGDNGYNMPEERLKILKEKGVIDEKGRVDVQKYMDLNPLEVGDTNALQHQDVLGFHQNIENGGRTVTYDRNYGYMRDPRRVASNAAHEYNHKMQEVFGIDNMSIYDEATGYYKANPDHTIGKMFQEVARKGQDDWWFNSPAELHSVVMEYKKVKGVAPDAEIDDKLLDKMLEIGMINKFFEVTAENKPKIKKLLNALPAVVPVAGAAAAGAARASNNDNVMDEGGVVGGADNYDIAFTHLTKERGLKPEQAVAIMANLDRESGLNPDIINSIGAYGIQQWLGPRKKELFKRYGEKPSLTQQLDFVLDEHQGKVKGMGWNFVNKGKNLGSDRFNYYMYSRSDFENAPSVADAIIAWNQGFGRPATHELNNEGRIKAGMQLAQRYGVDFGKNTYGQMGIIESDVPDWIVKDSDTIQPESFREYVKQHNYTTQNEGSNGIASYVPEKNDVVNKIDIEDKEEDDEETAYSKRLRERDEMISKKKKEDMAKLAMFEKIWNSISLRRKSNP